MWKKLKESASGLSTDFFSNLFRRRNYEQFGEDEVPETERFCAKTRKDSDVRDEENNRVYWRKEVHSYTPRSTHDDGFMNTDLVSYSSSEPGSLRRREVDRDSTADAGYGADNVKDMRPRELVSHNFGESRSRSPNRVSGELSDFLHSHTQGRYERLDDSDEEINYNDDVTMDTQRDSNVFHSIKDIDPKWNKSSKSSRRRKKMTKRARKLSLGCRFLEAAFIGDFVIVMTVYVIETMAFSDPYSSQSEQDVLSDGRGST